VVQEELQSETLQEFLFHLRRAYGQTNRPPISADIYSDYDRRPTDMILRLRLNRYVALSREGTVSLSWPTAKNPQNDFEVRTWHKRFFGIFLLLATHVQGELLMLLELSNLSADASLLLKQTLGDDLSLTDVNQARKTLFSTATLMTRYTLQMGNDNCGGLSEYVEFFSSLRSIFRIRNQRKELREEIQDVLALVEQSYIQEENKESQKKADVKAREKKLEMLKEKREAAVQSRYDTIVGAVSSLSIPPILVAGMLGMNLSDVPSELPFWGVVGVTLGVSVLLLLLFWLIPPPPVPEEEKRLVEEISKGLQQSTIRTSNDHSVTLSLQTLV